MTDEIRKAEDDAISTDGYVDESMYTGSDTADLSLLIDDRGEGGDAVIIERKKTEAQKQLPRLLKRRTVMDSDGFASSLRSAISKDLENDGYSLLFSSDEAKVNVSDLKEPCDVSESDEAGAYCPEASDDPAKTQDIQSSGDINEISCADKEAVRSVIPDDEDAETSDGTKFINEGEEPLDVTDIDDEAYDDYDDEEVINAAWDLVLPKTQDPMPVNESANVVIESKKESIPDGDDSEILHPDRLFSEDGVIRSSDSIVEEDDEGQYVIAVAIPEKTAEASVPVEEDPIYEPEAEEVAYNPDKPRRIDAIFDFLEIFVFTLLFVMLTTCFFFRHSIVDGGSMESTLYNGEHLIISDFFYEPKQFDIVVVEDHTTYLKDPIIKRVIATEGQRVQIDETGVYVDGVLLDEDYVYVDVPFFRYNELDVVVPENSIFVMGDHRNDSTDSRNIGTVSVDSVIGRVLVRIYPFDKFGKVE